MVIEEKYFSPILVILIIIIFIKFSYDYKNLIINSYILSSVELTSNLLSTYARNYIITANDRYKQQYFQVENIKDGNGNWDFLIPYPWFYLKEDTLLGLLSYVDLSPEEFGYMKNAVQFSIGLSWTNIVAMNYFEGRDDTDGKGRAVFEKSTGVRQFIEFQGKVPENEREKYKQRAINLLYDEKYLSTKIAIADLTKKVSKQVMGRLDNRLFWIKVVLMILLVILLGVEIKKGGGKIAS